MSLRAQRFGRYELLTELGRGGMAEVHLARLQGIGGFSKLCAIKLMLPHLSQNPQYVEQFLNEGRIAARISHPNVCQVFELGEVEGQLFLAMEYLEGTTWEELLRVLSADRVTLLRAVTGVFAQACEGLQHAHELRDDNGAPTPVVHRDMSPQNLFVTVDGTCKVLDFGVAKMGATATRTRTGVLKGKLPYMSPEQVKGEVLDPRSDVFAMGVMLWEAFSNRPLFLREVEFEILKAITEQPIDRVSRWEPGYGAEVDAVVMRALERARERRHGSMRELADDLRRLGESWGGALSPAELGALVRDQCSDRLAARSLELATFEVVNDDRPSSRDVATVVDGPAQVSVALRPDSLRLGRERRRHWPILVAGSALLAFAAIAIVATQGRSVEPKVAPPTAAAVGFAPEDGAVPVEIAPDAAAIAEATAHEVTTPDRDPETRAGVRSPSVKRHGATRKKAAEPEPERIVEQAKLDPGMLSLDVNPVSRVYIDGVFIDETPLFQHRVSAGRHELRIVPTQGDAKTVRVTIESGRVLNLGTLKL